MQKPAGFVDLDRDMLKPSIVSGRIFAYHTPEYIKDMGTPERYSQVSADMQNGITEQKNLLNKQKCIFLDRDGTINTSNGFVTKPESFEMIDGSTEAIRQINASGFLAIVITNQPAIARGDADFATLDLIHMKMETELGKLGAYIDDLFFCPHHPDKGFPGERTEYKIDCDCRKPKPGMILSAAEKYNIDLTKSYMVGDALRDVQAGINAGCIPVFLSNNKEGAISAVDSSILQFRNLKEFTAALVTI
jgi:D,D-heptose 1,7-bisphosphate phosphatase